MKDLLRSLLTEDHEKRIDWPSFFFHCVFQEQEVQKPNDPGLFNSLQRSQFNRHDPNTLFEAEKNIRARTQY